MFSDRRKRDMANHGEGTKYASLNLNKSYGYQSNQSGGYGANPGRGGGYGGGSGGGSMVVLSRPRSSQNAGPKLSVPPPLNLPSLRKEHERVDSSGLSFHSGGGISGSGTRPASSGMGWSKHAATPALQDVVANQTVEGVTMGNNGFNTPLVSRAEPVERAFHPVEKVAILRGEDFPSLKASLPSASVSGQKQKDSLNQKQKQQAAVEEFSKDRKGFSSMTSSLVDMRPHIQSGRSRPSNELSKSPSFRDGLHSSDQVRKKEYLPGLLPLVRLAPRSDWADDERDTSHGLRDRDRDHGYSKGEPYWDMGFDRENVRNNTGGRETSYQHGGRQPWNNNNMDGSSNRGTFARDGDKRSFKTETPHVEDPFIKDFGDSGFDVHNPFPILGAAKKKKEAKQTEFHDPVRESFEAELERVQKMQEEERRRIIEEQERVTELARTEEEERLRLAREEDERQRRLEEEAREATLRNDQEILEAARRSEELRKSKEEEKHRLFMEEERRKQAAKQKLIELEEKISRRQAEAAKGCSSSSTVSKDKFLDIVKEKESADVVDWEDSEKMVDSITTSSNLDISGPTRSFESNVALQFSRDGSFGFPDRQKPTWRKEDIESGSNSMFIPQNMENVPHSPHRDGGGDFPKKEFFGTAGYLSAPSYFKPRIPEHSVDQSWRIPGDGRTYGRNYGLESEPRESFGEQYGDPGWGQSQGRAHRGPYSPYPEKLYQNPEVDDYFPFGRPRYTVRQPRVLPPPQESRQKASFRSEVGHTGPSTSFGRMTDTHTGRTNSTVLASYIGDHHVLSGSGMDEHHRFDSKLTGRCDSQSSLSVTSPPDSPVHLSHDDLDESADSSVLAASRNREKDGFLEKGGAPTISSDSLKNSLMVATESVTCWDNEEWTLDSNERLQEQEEYDEDEDVYQEEEKIHGVDENTDLAQELEDMHLQDKDSNLVLGFNEGVEVEIPSDDFEKCQQNSGVRFPLTQYSVNSLDDERPSVETSVEQTAQPVEISDRVNMHNASRNFQDTEATLQNLTIQPKNGQQSFKLADKVSSSSNSTVSTHPSIPPHCIALHPSPSPLQTAIPHVSSTSTQMEDPFKFQFGLFSGPSLIPSPFPAIQIGSIQMPLPLHPHYGSSLAHIQQPQSPIIQFGQLQYTSSISQGVLPPPPHSVFQGNGLSTDALNQNPRPLVTVQPRQGNLGNLPVRNASASVSSPQLSVLKRPVNVSDGGTLKNANISPTRASIEATMSPQKQIELLGKSELPSRMMSHGKSNLAEKQSGSHVQTEKTTVRNSGLRSSGSAEVSMVDSGGYIRYRRKRGEFRGRESNWPSDENRNGNGRAHNPNRNGSRKYVVSNKSQKQALDGSVSNLNATRNSNSGDSYQSRTEKDAVVKTPLLPNSGQANLKRNMVSHKEIDAPLRSGIVRVFEQQGIETPSDDDDFIEVRSKRQMLNDRREQREKEIKEKSQASKASRKPRSTLQNSTTAARSNRSPSGSQFGNNKQFYPLSNRQQLAPIGTPSPKLDSHADVKSGSSKSSQATIALQVIPKNDQSPVSGFVFSNQNKVLNNIQTSVGTWGNQLTDQAVMALTQSQLDEAMKPVSLLSCDSVENGANLVSEPNSTSTSVMPKNNTFTSRTSSKNSLLAEGKIQFGAVTSSTVIPPCGEHTENGSPLYFEKNNKHRSPSSTGMEICEAEATASAIAVAAITNDETVGNALVTGSVLPVETKNFGGTQLVDGAAIGSVGGQPSLSKAEESLIVSLPADLSVDTPISLWPPLPSPHNSNQMITQFPPGPPHFPFYDVNPMLRGPIFAFGPHHDSRANQSQSQKGPGTVSGPPTTWQQPAHSGVDSFYAPPAGFTGPFLTPPGAMPGVQVPPHMFVYNHFALVGQFGGLSFMGTTYIPSGKEPDWKHNPIVSSASVGTDGEANNRNVSSLQCNMVPASLQHLPMPSPLPMFDPSPFQSSSQEMPVRAQWPSMPFSGPPTMQIQKQQEAADGSNLSSSQFNNSMPPNRYPNIQSSAVADAMVNASNSYSSTTTAAPPKPTTTLSDTKSNNLNQNPTGSGFKPPPPPPQQQSSQEKNTPSQHVGGSSHYHQHQHNRRSGFHGRNQPMARERGYQNNTKVKQIYVAKQTCNSNASASSTTTTSPSI